MSAVNDDFFNNFDDQESSESYDSSSVETIMSAQRNPPDPVVLNFGDAFKNRIPLANTDDVLKKPENSIKIPPQKHENPLIAPDKREFSEKKVSVIEFKKTPSNSKILIESDDGVSSIDSKPSIKTKPKEPFHFNINEMSNKLSKPTINFTSSKKYEKNNSSSSSSEDFESNNSIKSGAENIRIDLKKEQSELSENEKHLNRFPSINENISRKSKIESIEIPKINPKIESKFEPKINQNINLH